jgi:glycerol-3-phosphate dehydrogenase (NAD(P)+)
MRVAVLGAGSWGTALAVQAARNGLNTTLWGRDAAQLDAMRATHRNTRYLPDLELPSTLNYSVDLAACVASADLVLIVVPSHAFAELVREIAPHRPPMPAWPGRPRASNPAPAASCMKSRKTRSAATPPLAIVTGPSFAREVAQGLPTA